MKQSDWPAEWTAQIGRAIRHARERSGLSAEALSRRCGDLGAPIPRNTISNLENGRKTAIPLHEVMVLAAALGQAPVELMAPFATSARMRALPGATVDAYDVAQWISGDVVYGEDGSFHWADKDEGAINMRRAFLALVDQWVSARHELADRQREVAINEARLARASVEEPDQVAMHEGHLAMSQAMVRHLTQRKPELAQAILSGLESFMDRGDLAPGLPEGMLDQIREDAAPPRQPRVRGRGVMGDGEQT